MTPSDDMCRLAELLDRMVDAGLTDAEHEQLAALLHADAAARTFYLDFMAIHARLVWKNNKRIDERRLKIEERNDAWMPAESPLQPPTTSLPPPISALQPPAISHELAASIFSRTSWREYIIPCAASAAIMLALGFWAWMSKISTMPTAPRQDQNIADAKHFDDSHSGEATTVEKSRSAAGNQRRQVVGRITAEADCRWELTGRPRERETGRRGDEETGSVAGSTFSQKHQSKSPPLPVSQSPRLVCLGDKLTVTSGLMEITYDTGAKVILEGPCRFNVETNGGFLAVGRLTGRMEKKGKGREARDEGVGNRLAPVSTPGGELHGQQLAAGSAKPQAAFSNPQSLIPNPSLSTAHCPLPTTFVIATPTALVTDLGTEFGIRVDAAGQTETQVFVGEVVAAALDKTGKTTTQSVHLHAGEMTTFVVGLIATPTIRKTAALDASRFVRSVPNSIHHAVTLFRDDADQVASAFSVDKNAWNGRGWRLEGSKVFYVRNGLNVGFSRRAMIDVNGSCWGVEPSTTAVRDFGCELPIGGAFVIDFDADPAPQGVSLGFALCNAAEESRFEFSLENGLKDYFLRDRLRKTDAARDTHIPYTDQGLHLQVTRTGEDTYWLRVVRIADHRVFSGAGQFIAAPSGGEIRRLRVWNKRLDNVRGSVSKEPNCVFYFNQIGVVGLESNAMPRQNKN